MYMHACVNFVFGLGFLMPGRLPDIYANIPKSKANQESETFLSQHFGKGCSVCLCTENESAVDLKGFCSESQKNGEGAALRKTNRQTDGRTGRQTGSPCLPREFWLCGLEELSTHLVNQCYVPLKCLGATSENNGLSYNCVQKKISRGAPFPDLRLWNFSYTV